MTISVVLDFAGRRRSPATLPGYRAGRPPRNKGMRYPSDPPTIEEIVAVMRVTRLYRHGRRLRAMVKVFQELVSVGRREPAWRILSGGAPRELVGAGA